MLNDFSNIPPATNVAIQHRIDTRSMQTLLGICTGIIADESIQDKEIMFLKTWLVDHQAICNEWPANAIHYKINEILADGIITAEERADLLALLQQLTGNNFSETGAAAPDGPALPIDNDPKIFFKNMTFCFTGKFLYGTRSACEEVILKFGAQAADKITKNLDYLVIGSMINPNWLHETYGLKIQKTVEYKEKGASICIISERQWSDALIDLSKKLTNEN
jgi:NAD-dependent DNA ligase